MTVDQWGIENRYEDALGKWHRLEPASRSALLEAMGVEPSSATAHPEFFVKVVRLGAKLSLPGPGELILENGTKIRINKNLPQKVSMGYHRFEAFDGSPPVKIIVVPGRCYLPPGLKAWGWALQLYALRSRKSWGIGDLGDLRSFARWSAKHFYSNILLLNPLHSATPGVPQNPSPYFPSSRLFRNALYIRVEEVPGASHLGNDLERFQARGEALNREPLIRRDAIFKEKIEALEQIWYLFGGDSRFEAYVAEQEEPLKRFALFCVLSERFGQKWSKWPEEFRHPESVAVGRFAQEAQDRVRFHQWIQWILDEQLAMASEETGLMQDLPIGFDPEGADAWAWQDLLASGCTVGAPPDEFNRKGQDWGLPPFIPHKLKAAAYEPIRQTFRATLRHGRGLRIDHVMGLFRLFWIPKGYDPSEGGYIRYPAEDLLGIAALESQRCKAFIVGEDLGTVEKKAKERLRRYRVLSYRLLWFEKRKPKYFPRFAMAAVTTHDLPTIAGLWSGDDLKTQKELNLRPNEEGIEEIRNRLAAWTGLSPSAPPGEVILPTYRLLSDAPSAVITATLEDALGVKERPNMPSTTSEWPNWSIPLPIFLEEIKKHSVVRKVADTIRKQRPVRPRKKERTGAPPPDNR